MKKRSGGALAALAALAVSATLAACGSSDDSASGNEASSGCGTGLAALTAAAKKEGSVVWYTGVPAEAADEAANAFSDKYGFKPEVLKLPSAGILQRYSTEAEAGNIAADVVVTPGAGKFADSDGIPKGWVVPIADAKVPVIEDGTFPKDFLLTGAATVSIQPWLIAVNTDVIPEADAPKDWSDLADPKYKGKLMIPDPSASDAYIELWTLLEQKYGKELLTGIAANQPKKYDSGGSTNQALGAGEGGMNISTTGSSVAGVIQAGAPVITVQPQYTTGAEMQLMVTNPDKAPHPCAGRLLADFLASEDGSKAQSEKGNAISVYDTANLPSEYQAPPKDAASNKDAILSGLGLS